MIMASPGKRPGRGSGEKLASALNVRGFRALATAECAGRSATRSNAPTSNANGPSWWTTVKREDWGAAQTRHFAVPCKSVRDCLRWSDEAQAIRAQKEMLFRRVHGPYR